MKGYHQTSKIPSFLMKHQNFSTFKLKIGAKMILKMYGLNEVMATQFISKYIQGSLIIQ